MPQNRAALAVITGVILILLAAAFLLHTHTTQEAQRRQDAQLKAAADALAPLIVQHKTDYPGQTFVDALHIYLFGLQASLKNHRTLLAQGDRFVQVQVYDPSTTPPQDLVLNAPGHLSVYADIPTMTRIGQAGTPEYETITQNGTALRAYIRPLALPPVFSQQGVVQVIEALAPQAG